MVLDSSVGFCTLFKVFLKSKNTTVARIRLKILESYRLPGFQVNRGLAVTETVETHPLHLSWNTFLFIPM